MRWAAVVAVGWLCGAVGSADEPSPPCGPHGKPDAAGRHCVCDENTKCTGSKCSHATASSLGLTNLLKIRHGYPLEGVHKCTDCVCTPNSAESGESTTVTDTMPTPDVKLRIFAGIKSGTSEKYQERRNAWRKSECAKMYAAAGIGYKFFVGVPIDTGHALTHHNQGGHDTPHERQLEKMLEKEATEFGDLELLPFRDQYMDITNKLLGILRYGYYRTNADYIAEQDDEYCMQVPVAMGLIDKHEKTHPDQELYAGNYKWEGTEYGQMRGVEGLIAPYYSGWCSYLSRKLVGYIVDADWAHSVMAGSYGTTADDANTGKWVKYAQDKHGVKVEFLTHGMVQDISKMNGAK